MVELLADALRRAGHAPMIFAPTLGPQAERMQARGHIVVDRLAMLPQRPDVMHLQHITPALMALVAFYLLGLRDPDHDPTRARAGAHDAAEDGAEAGAEDGIDDQRGDRETPASVEGSHTS